LQDFGEGFADLGSSADAFGSGSDPFAADFGAPAHPATFPATSDPFGGEANPFAPSATEADAFATDDAGFGTNPFSSPPEAATHAPDTVVQHPTAKEFGFTAAPGEGIEPANNAFAAEAEAAPLETKRSFFRAPEQAAETAADTPAPEDLHVHEHEHVHDGASTGFTEATAFDLHGDHHEGLAAHSHHHDDAFAQPEAHHDAFAQPEAHHDAFAQPEAHMMPLHRRSMPITSPIMRASQRQKHTPPPSLSGKTHRMPSQPSKHNTIASRIKRPTTTSSRLWRRCNMHLYTIPSGNRQTCLHQWNIRMWNTSRRRTRPRCRALIASVLPMPSLTRRHKQAAPLSMPLHPSFPR
jgi:hypothetical protein